MANASKVLTYGFVLAGREQVDDLAPPSVVRRVQKRTGAFFVWDGEDHPDCWLLVGDDPESLATETMEAFEIP